MTKLEPAYDLKTKSWFLPDGREAKTMRELERQLRGKEKLEGLVSERLRSFGFAAGHSENQGAQGVRNSESRPGRKAVRAIAGRKASAGAMDRGQRAHSPRLRCAENVGRSNSRRAWRHAQFDNWEGRSARYRVAGKSEARMNVGDPVRSQCGLYEGSIIEVRPRTYVVRFTLPGVICEFEYRHHQIATPAGQHSRLPTQSEVVGHAQSYRCSGCCSDLCRSGCWAGRFFGQCREWNRKRV